MKPSPLYCGLDHRFWALVRAVSEQVGYTERGTGLIKSASPKDINKALAMRGLVSSPPNEGFDVDVLAAYLDYRADSLNSTVQHLLMDSEEAAELFYEYRDRLSPTCPLPMNKQKKEKRQPAYLTCLINMLVEANAHGGECDFDPRALTTFTRGDSPLRTLSRRLDGAFPSTVNPVAVWEIKEYYYTTTFGSRVSGGVYETLLDGMELQELRENEGVDVRHYLMVDSHNTWWNMGRSYLCRVVDMLNMGLVDEVLFGREVTTELPRLVKEWSQALSSRPAGGI